MLRDNHNPFCKIKILHYIHWRYVWMTSITSKTFFTFLVSKESQCRLLEEVNRIFCRSIHRSLLCCLTFAQPDESHSFLCRNKTFVFLSCSLKALLQSWSFYSAVYTVFFFFRYCLLKCLWKCWFFTSVRIIHSRPCHWQWVVYKDTNVCKCVPSLKKGLAKLITPLLAAWLHFHLI